jgi:hypothetical protein
MIADKSWHEVSWHSRSPILVDGLSTQPFDRSPENRPIDDVKDHVFANSCVSSESGQIAGAAGRLPVRARLHFNISE